MKLLSTLVVAFACPFVFAAQPAPLIPVSEQPEMYIEGAGISIMKASPEFSYAAAEAAFASARVPAPEEIIGKWMLIGQVSDPKYGDVASDGYWPDGKFKAPAWGTGYFRVIAKIESFRDAFGTISLKWTHRLVGDQSGKVYYKKGPETGAISATGFHFELAATDSVCRTEVECRIVQSNGMFLCQMKSSDRRSECKRTRATGYDGMTKLPY